MNRATGTGLIGLGIALVVVGAILAFAVSVTPSGFNISTVGVILLIVGSVSFLTGLGLFWASSGPRRTSIHEDIRNTPSGRERTYEERGDIAS